MSRWLSLLIQYQCTTFTRDEQGYYYQLIQVRHKRGKMVHKLSSLSALYKFVVSYYIFFLFFSVIKATIIFHYLFFFVFFFFGTYFPLFVSFRISQYRNEKKQLNFNILIRMQMTHNSRILFVVACNFNTTRNESLFRIHFSSFLSIVSDSPQKGQRLFFIKQVITFLNADKVLDKVFLFG